MLRKKGSGKTGNFLSKSESLYKAHGRRRTSRVKRKDILAKPQVVRRRHEGNESSEKGNGIAGGTGIEGGVQRPRHPWLGRPVNGSTEAARWSAFKKGRVITNRCSSPPERCFSSVNLSQVPTVSTRLRAGRELNSMLCSTLLVVSPFERRLERKACFPKSGEAERHAAAEVWVQ
jgi:hypothetical protein